MNKIAKVKKIAARWFNELAFNEQLARMQSTIKGVDFNAVSAEYGRLYEESERLGANKWN